MTHTSLFDDDTENGKPIRNGSAARLKAALVWTLVLSGVTYMAKGYADGHIAMIQAHEHALNQLAVIEAKREAQYAEILRRLDRIESSVEKRR